MNQAAVPVVTGLGVISAIGSDTAAFWQSLLSGRSGVGPVRAFSTAGFATHIGCEVDDSALDAERRRAPSAGRAALLAAAAGRQALAAAGLGAAELRSTALCLGTTMGEACWLEAWDDEQVRAGPAAVPSHELLRSGPDQVALDTVRSLELGGRATVLAAACAAGNYAIARAADLVRWGRVPRVLAIGTDAFSRVAYTGFARLGALAAETCRPFDAERDGIVLAEGAGALLIESAAAAWARGVRPLAYVTGAGLSCDAHHIVSPHPDGAGALEAMQAALRDARLQPQELDWVCAHGTGTPANDRAEVAALRALCADRRVPMSSLKALTGHSLGAASAVEAVACVLALCHQMIPPSHNIRRLDPQCDWDIPLAPRRAALRHVLNNAYAFGGNNASIVFGSVDKDAPRRHAKTREA